EASKLPTFQTSDFELQTYRRQTSPSSARRAPSPPSSSTPQLFAREPSSVRRADIKYIAQARTNRLRGAAIANDCKFDFSRFSDFDRRLAARCADDIERRSLHCRR